MNLIEKLFAIIGRELDAFVSDMRKEVQRLADSAGPAWFLPSLKYPLTPKLFELGVDFWITVLDAFGNRFSRLPAQIVAEVLIEAFPVPEEFKTKVCTLEAAMKLPVVVLVRYGLQSAGPPQTWQVFKAFDKLGKIQSFIRFPTAARGFKIAFGGIWGRAITLLLLLGRMIAYAAILFVLWAYLKDVQTLAREIALDQSKRRQRFIAEGPRGQVQRLLLRVPHS